MITRSIAGRRPCLMLRPARLMQYRSLVAAPSPNSGPLMERRADRELPPLPSRGVWKRSLPIFLVVMGVCSLAIFNYQKSNSSVVASTLYALRIHPEARAMLGDEIYFAQQIPWIWGTISQLQGKIDISFSVKGTKARGTMTFKSERKSKSGFFDTTEWTLKSDSGETISLLGKENVDPMAQA